MNDTKRMLLDLAIISWIITLFPLLGFIYFMGLSQLSSEMEEFQKFSIIDRLSDIMGENKNISFVLITVMFIISLYISIQYSIFDENNKEQHENLKTKLKFVSGIIIVMFCASVFLLLKNRPSLDSIKINYIVLFYLLLSIFIFKIYHISTNAKLRNDYLVYIIVICISLAIHFLPPIYRKISVKIKSNMIKGMKKYEYEPEYKYRRSSLQHPELEIEKDENFKRAEKAYFDYNKEIKELSKKWV
jgi:hypothetical protein